jgi:SAM-dependent methyltransferase
MLYSIGLISLSLMILLAWSWRYVVKPRIAKNDLHQYFKNHPFGHELKKKEKFLKLLYKNTPTHFISYRERKRLKMDEDAFTYGEIEFLSFFSLLDIVKPQSHEIFYDLGSGSGKALFAVAFYGEIAQCYGIEFLPKLYQLANSKITKAKTLSAPLEKISRIHFINQNFLEYDISHGDIIFINATCLSYDSWEKIQQKLLKLKTGSRIMVTTKKILNEQFKIIHQGMTLMSWGVNSIYIYQKT